MRPSLAIVLLALVAPAVTAQQNGIPATVSSRAVRITLGEGQSQSQALRLVRR